MEAATLLSFHTHPSLNQNSFQVEGQAKGRWLVQLHFSAGCLGIENGASVKKTGRVYSWFAQGARLASGFSTQSCKL